MRKILVLLLSLTMFCTACSTAWVATLDSILAAAAPALINILQIVAVANGQPLNSTLAGKINSDAAAIKTLAADFASAAPSAGEGVCQELQAAIATYQADQQLVLQVAQVSDSSTQTKITLLTGLVAGTISAITAVIPSCQGASALRDPKIAPSYDVSNFADRYNRILLSPTGNAAVDAVTPKLKLRQHSAFTKFVTFGLLK
jgi:hypothetical protein